MTGEEKHEQCRFGTFARQAFVHHVDGGQEKPFAMPLCSWQTPRDVPPPLERMWGGAIDMERDCKACTAYDPIL